MTTPTHVENHERFVAEAAQRIRVRPMHPLIPGKPCYGYDVVETSDERMFVLATFRRIGRVLDLVAARAEADSFAARMRDRFVALAEGTLV